MKMMERIGGTRFARLVRDPLGIKINRAFFRTVVYILFVFVQAAKHSNFSPSSSH
jgi:hypothetical protein